MARYSAVLFDMFDTLVRFDRDRLPAVRIGGREVRSSVPELHSDRRRRPAGGGARDVLRRVPLELPGGRSVPRREPRGGARAPAARALLSSGRASIPPRSLSAVTERLLATHMACLAGAAEPMPGQGELLDWLQGALPPGGRLELRLHADRPAHPHRERHSRPLRDRGRVGHGGLAEAAPRHLPARPHRDGGRGRGVPLRRRPAGHRRRRRQGSRHGGGLAQPGPGASASRASRPRTSTWPAFPTSGPPWRPHPKGS